MSLFYAAGIEYKMEEEDSFGSAVVYAIDANSDTSAFGVDRHVSIYRTTTAPKFCFGLETSDMVPEAEEPQKGRRTPKASGSKPTVATHKYAFGEVKENKKKKKLEGAEDKKKRKKQK